MSLTGDSVEARIKALTEDVAADLQNLTRPLALQIWRTRFNHEHSDVVNVEAVDAIQDVAIMDVINKLAYVVQGIRAPHLQEEKS